MVVSLHYLFRFSMKINLSLDDGQFFKGHFNDFNLPFYDNKIDLFCDILYYSTKLRPLVRVEKPLNFINRFFSAFSRTLFFQNQPW